MMITEGEQGIAFEVDRRRINPEGVYRYMLETGHCPLRDYDIERLGRAFGLYVGSMRQFIKKNGLDARLEDEVMGKVNYSEVEDLFNQGKSDSEIAKALKISLPSVSLWRKRNGLQPNGQKLAKKVAPEYLEDHVDLEKAKAEIRIEFDKTKQLTADEEAEVVKAVFDSWVKTTKIDSDKPCEPTPEVYDLQKEFNEKATVEISVEQFRKLLMPDESGELIARLKAERLILIGIAIGSGRYDADLVREVIYHA